MTDKRKEFTDQEKQDIRTRIAQWSMENPDPNALETRRRLSSYLGEHADKVIYAGRPVIEADAYAKRYLMNGSQYGPTEYYTYSSETGQETFVGLMNEKGEVFACNRTSDGDFIVKGEDGKDQVWLSGENTVKREGKRYQVQQFDYRQGAIIDQHVRTLPDKVGDIVKGQRTHSSRD